MDAIDPARSLPGKRAFDVIVSLIAIVVTLPLMVATAIGVRVTSRGPIIYRASRVGRGGAPFVMYKFRSMLHSQASETSSPTTGRNDPRVTRFGRAIRKCKIDELPQLFNVLRGDMSLVGPRPEVQECVDLYDDRLRQILAVRPGITDLASIRYSNLADDVGESDDPHAVYLTTVFMEKNELRLAYVMNQSWAMDMKILAKTFAELLPDRR